MISDKTIIKRIGFIVALTAFTGTALAGITDIARDAKNGDESAQRQLSNRYVSGSEVVKDDLLAEQWLLRSDPNRSASSGGDALRKLQEKRDKSGEKNGGLGVKIENVSATAVVRTDSVSRHRTPTSGKNSLRKKDRSVSREVPKEEKPVAHGDDFQRLLRAASQGNRLALQRFKSDAGMKNRLESYAETPEGKKNPFVSETLRHLKN